MNRPAERTAMRAEVARGLSTRPRELSPKWFYDRRGSELFRAITRLPVYYPTRSERALLESFAPGWIRERAPGALVELGAGAADKTRILLEALLRASPGAVYVPVDISAEFLEASAARLRREFPELEVHPRVADMAGDHAVPDGLPGPTVVALLGGTIGNFDEDASRSLVAGIARALRAKDRFLLGVDLHKDTAVLEAAYNDPAGLTAAFNLNILRVLNRELGADFDPSAFRHRAFYDAGLRHIEMHLVATRPVDVTIPEVGRFFFEAGESVRTEISRKYDRSAVEALLDGAGLALDRWIEGPDRRHRFALAVAAPT